MKTKPADSSVLPGSRRELTRTNEGWSKATGGIQPLASAAQKPPPPRRRRAAGVSSRSDNSGRIQFAAPPRFVPSFLRRSSRHIAALLSGTPFVTAIRGRVGDVVFKTYGRKIIMTRVPCFDGYVPSAAQRTRRDRMREATAFAKRVYAHPEAKAFYTAAARKLGRQAFRLAISDYINGYRRLPAARPELVLPRDGGTESPRGGGTHDHDLLDGAASREVEYAFASDGYSPANNRNRIAAAPSLLIDIGARCVMYSHPERRSASPHRFIGPLQPATNSDETRRAFTSGFGAIMEQENDLLSSTDECLGTEIGIHAASLDRILREQRTRVGVNVSLLEQCYETLPSPSRFQGLQGRFGPPTRAANAGPTQENGRLLQGLVAQHLHLRDNIELLVAHDPQWPSIMAEVARNHEEMAWMLTALLKEDESMRDRVSEPVTAAAASLPTPGTTEGNWENEGGASRVVRRAPDAPASRRV